MAWLGGRGFVPVNPADGSSYGYKEQAQEKASMLAPWDRGPSARRPPLADHYRIGRAIFGRLPPIQGVRDEHGILRTDPQEMDDTLWRSRAAVWATTPPAPECGQAILHADFTDRPVLDHIGIPSHDKLAGVVVQPAGSAPGHDGTYSVRGIPPWSPLRFVSSGSGLSYCEDFLPCSGMGTETVLRHSGLDSQE